jgi:hypothetical protein
MSNNILVPLNEKFYFFTKIPLKRRKKEKKLFKGEINEEIYGKEKYLSDISCTKLNIRVSIIRVNPQKTSPLRE